MTEKQNANTLFLPAVSLCEGQALKNHSNLLQNTVFVYPFFYCMNQHQSGLCIQWWHYKSQYTSLFNCQMQIYLSGFLLSISQLKFCLATVIVNKHNQAWGILSVPTQGTQERNVLFELSGSVIAFASHLGVAWSSEEFQCLLIFLMWKIAQRDYGGFFLADMQKPSGHNSNVL